MKNRYAVLITLLVILLPPAAFLASNYNLITTRPPMEVVHLPEMKILYIDHKGSYNKAPTFIVEIYQAMAKEKIQCQELLGQYFDGRLVDEDKRRSRYACVVADYPKNIPAGFAAGTIAESDYVKTKRVEQGPAVNVMYGLRMMQYAQENDYNAAGFIMEMYTPVRLNRGQAEMYQAIKKRDPIGAIAPDPVDTGAELPYSTAE